jgi:hypothetical protein
MGSIHMTAHFSVSARLLREVHRTKIRIRKQYRHRLSNLNIRNDSLMLGNTVKMISLSTSLQ